MIKIPVTKDFSKEQVGNLVIFDDDFKIPFNSVFAIGGKIKAMKKVYNRKTKKYEEIITDYEITEISLIPDENYEKYLKSDQRMNYKPEKKSNNQ